MPCSRPSFPPTGPLGPQPRGRCRQVQETCGGCEGLGSRGPGRAPEGRALWSPGSPGSGPSQARRAEVVQNKAQPQGVHVLGGPWEGLHLVWIQEGALLRLHRPAGGQPPWLRDSDKALKTQGPGAPGGRDRGCHGTLSRGPSRLSGCFCGPDTVPDRLRPVEGPSSFQAQRTVSRTISTRRFLVWESHLAKLWAPLSTADVYGSDTAMLTS